MTDATSTKNGLFDHVVGAGEQRRRHVETDRLGGLEIDHQLVPDRRLHRKVGRLLALEDVDRRIAPRAGTSRGKSGP
jgi:hypothetical protein